MKYMSNMLGALCFAVMLPMGSLFAADAELIDIAGSQRMLTQRILKSYAQIGLDEIYGNPDRQLSEAVNRFEAQMGTIKGSSSDAKVIAALGKVEQLWPAYKALVTAPPSKESAVKLMAMNGELLPATHAVVVALEESSGSKTSEIVNLAGRQRMLSQRMAMFYMLQIWGVEDTSITTELDKANNEFRDAHQRLMALPGNDIRITNGLRRVSNSIELLEHTLSKKGNNLTFTVAMTTERMLNDMNEVTSEYASLDDKQ